MITNFLGSSFTFENLIQETFALLITALHVCEQPAMDEQSTREHISVRYESTHMGHTYMMATYYEVPVYSCCLNNKLRIGPALGIHTSNYTVLIIDWVRNMPKVAVYSQYKLCPNLQSYESQFVVLAYSYRIRRNFRGDRSSTKIKHTNISPPRIIRDTYEATRVQDEGEESRV